MEQNEAQKKYDRLRLLLDKAIEKYNAISCPCAFPRYLQLTGINCTKSGNSFVCYETDLLISKSKPFFDIGESTRTDENRNEKWTCKKCGSVYEFGWSDFSIHVNRQKLEPAALKVDPVGKPVQNPIPLFMGLWGHSYPSKSQMTTVDYEEFEKYILEE
ncbi:hypothetical protein [Flavobacterium sp.]|uniref:hypothetical protein n=1 Tax=Flavobacterium sp. TaxID=239 RepID=UPI0039E615B4